MAPTSMERVRYCAKIIAAAQGGTDLAMHEAMEAINLEYRDLTSEVQNPQAVAGAVVASHVAAAVFELLRGAAPGNEFLAGVVDAADFEVIVQLLSDPDPS